MLPSDGVTDFLFNLVVKNTSARAIQGAAGQWLVEVPGDILKESTVGVGNCDIEMCDLLKICTDNSCLVAVDKQKKGF